MRIFESGKIPTRCPLSSQFSPGSQETCRPRRRAAAAKGKIAGQLVARGGQPDAPASGRSGGAFSSSRRTPTRSSGRSTEPARCLRALALAAASSSGGAEEKASVPGPLPLAQPWGLSALGGTCGAVNDVASAQIAHPVPKLLQRAADKGASNDRAANCDLCADHLLGGQRGTEFTS
jgi:hypothetical protein